MRHFIVRATMGHIDPQMLMTGLWPSPQWSRMLAYSVVIHLCFATSLILFKALNLSFRRLPAVVYRVDLVEFERAKPKRSEKVAKRTPKKPDALKPKAKPKPKPEPQKPAPKPTEKKKAPPPPEKKVEVPKVVKPPEPKKKPPEAKPKPEPPKKEPLPPPPEPEPIDVAKTVQTEAEPVASSTVKLDADIITPELKWYIEVIRRKVWQNWMEPRHAVPLGANARVVIRFEINRDGEFASDPVVFESSNISLFDQSGYRAVLRSAPFPPLPEGYSADSLGVRFGFEYGERA